MLNEDYCSAVELHIHFYYVENSDKDIQQYKISILSGTWKSYKFEVTW